MELNFVAAQAAIAALMPFLVSVLKAALPNLEGQAALIVNVVLTLLGGLGYAAATGDPLLGAGITGVGFGLAGSKVFDMAKRGTDPKYRGE